MKYQLISVNERQSKNGETLFVAKFLMPVTNFGRIEQDLVSVSVPLLLGKLLIGREGELINFDFAPTPSQYAIQILPDSANDLIVQLQKNATSAKGDK